MEERERQERLKQSERNLISMFGERYSGAMLSTWQMHGTEEQKLRQLCVRGIVAAYLDNIDKHMRAGTNLLMIGPPGTGKDHLLVPVARAAVRRCHSVRVISGANLWGECRDIIGSNRLESEFLRKLVDVDCLVLSDPLPPRATLTDHQAAWLYRIIDGRYRKMKATWVTLNIGNRTEAESRLTHQVWDRLREGAVVCECMWNWYRKPV